MKWHLPNNTLIIFVIGIICGVLSTQIYLQLHGAKDSKQQDIQLLNQINPIRSKSKNNLFTAPLLGYEIPESAGLPEYKPLEQKIEAIIKSKTDTGKIDKASVYFRDNNRGRWVGVNENTTYSPASLLKVPLMMVYYKIAENDPSRLQNKITYQGGSDLNAMERIKPSQQLTIGKSYTVDELINRMIIESDNNATELLLGNIDRNTLQELFSDLNIKLPEDGQPTDYLSAKSYSLFFRLLYNVTFLDQKYSESALSLLTQTKFKDGLVAGIPSGTPIAHKFGEYASDNSSELHDCGNIYASDNPYLLCVMTAGKDLDALKTTIKEIAATVYNELKQQGNN